jgi:flagellar biosynthesis/type III secretory pathway protein FliH
MAPVTTAVGKLKAKILARDAKYAALEQKIADLKVAHENAIAEARTAGFDAGYKKGIKDAAEHLKELS